MRNPEFCQNQRNDCVASVAFLTQSVQINEGRDQCNCMKKFGGVNTGSNACKSDLRLKTNQVESEVYKCVFVQKPLDALLP